MSVGELFEGQAWTLWRRKPRSPKGRETLDRIDRIYLGVLDEVKRAVGGLNQAARGTVRPAVSRKPALVIAASILLAGAAALAFGFFFAHRIAAPIPRALPATPPISARAAGCSRSRYRG